MKMTSGIGIDILIQGMLLALTLLLSLGAYMPPAVLRKR